MNHPEAFNKPLIEDKGPNFPDHGLVQDRGVINERFEGEDIRQKRSKFFREDPNVGKRQSRKNMKLSMKTFDQKRILNNYFACKQSDWTREEIKNLSERTKLSFRAVKKWLWDHREKYNQLQFYKNENF